MAPMIGWFRALRKVQPGRNVHFVTQRLLTPGSTSDGDGLRKLRQAAGLSQGELATQTGYSLKTISRWERGAGAPRLAVLEHLQRLLERRPNGDGRDGTRFRFIDLFAGIGGLRIAFDRLGGECVFTCELDSYAQRTYRANFLGVHPIAGDVIQVPSEHIPSHDLLLAGFPCQPFSIAGVSKKNALGRPHGFACETQGTLFFEVARILRYHRPAAFLLENVKNLIGHDHGNTLRVILGVLQEDLGYQVHWRVIDAACFVPQHRERIFIVGFRDSTDFDWNRMRVPKTRPRLRSILHPEDGSESPEAPYTDESGKVAAKYYLTQHLWSYLQAYAERHKRQGNGFGFGLVGRGDIARTLSARYYKDGAEILVRTRRRTPRRLTPRECARLMGFDAPDRADWKIPVSDTRAYRQFGNAVVVPVVEEVARLMKPYLLGERTRSEQLDLPLGRLGAA
jgi:DNA (cytosine-5)-methyltransferase 1